MTLSVGFIGAGGITSIHLETLDTAIDGGLTGRDGGMVGVELIAVADVDTSRARETAEPRDAEATDSSRIASTFKTPRR